MGRKDWRPVLEFLNNLWALGARNRVGIGLSYPPARAEFVPWNQFPAGIFKQSMGARNCVGKGLSLFVYRPARLHSELEFLKSLWGLGTEEEEGYRTGPPEPVLWSPEIDSKEWIPSAYVAWRADTITLCISTRCLAPIDFLKIQGQAT
jgi:hypothetical protein